MLKMIPMILIIRLTIMILTILWMSLLSFDEEDLIAFLAYAENIKDERRENKNTSAL